MFLYVFTHGSLTATLAHYFVTIATLAAAAVAQFTP
jgi:hypothetical protein